MSWSTPSKCTLLAPDGMLLFCWELNRSLCIVQFLNAFSDDRQIMADPHSASHLLVLLLSLQNFHFPSEISLSLFNHYKTLIYSKPY